MKMIFLAVALAGVSIAAVPRHATPSLHQCRTPRTIDGDTIACGRIHLRLLGIDTPDHLSAAPCRGHYGDHVCDDALATAATASMRSSLVGKVTYLAIHKDRYGRTVAQVFVNGADLQCIQLKAGVARYLPKYDVGKRIATSCGLTA